MKNVNYKKMFEMKQDDWLEACEEIGALEDEVNKLKEIISLYEKDNDLLKSWVKHHQRTVEIQLKKVKELERELEAKELEKRGRA